MDILKNILKLNNMDEDEIHPEDKIINGVIVQLNDKGFGFITSTEMKFTRFFFHWSALVNNTLKFPELKRGMRVTFQPKELEGLGWRAIKIKVVSDDSR